MGTDREELEMFSIKITEDHFPNLGKEMPIQIQKTSYRQDNKRNTHVTEFKH